REQHAVQHAAGVSVLQARHPRSWPLVRAFCRVRSHGRVERRESDRWTRRAGDQHLCDRGRRVYRAGLRRGQPPAGGIPAAHTLFRGRRAHGVLRIAGGGVAGIPLVQLLSCRNLHGRRGLAGARRGAGYRRDPDQAGTAARNRWRSVRPRSALGRDSGGVLQDDRQTRLQDGAAPPSLRADRLERTQGDHALRHRIDHLCLVQFDDVEAQMTFDVKGKRVTVAGAARSGLASAELVARRGADVTLSESRTDVAEGERLRSLGVRLELGGHLPKTFARADLVVLSPGVPPDQPAIQAARDRGIPVIAEIELASRWLKGRVIAITGTKGKSTTTALTARMLEAAGYKVTVGGNIRAPLSAQVSESTPDTFHVVETSSFQLEQIDTFHPWIAVMLNFS